MTQYMFLLIDDQSWHDGTEAQWEEGLAAHGAFAAAVEAAGARILDGNALQHTRTSTTVRNDQSGLVTDGPFIETKEALGGYYVIDAADLDQALGLAKQCPSPIVEVRPVLDTSPSSQPPGSSA